MKEKEISPYVLLKRKADKKWKCPRREHGCGLGKLLTTIQTLDGTQIQFRELNKLKVNIKKRNQVTKKYKTVKPLARKGKADFDIAASADADIGLCGLNAKWKKQKMTRWLFVKEDKNCRLRFRPKKAAVATKAAFKFEGTVEKFIDDIVPKLFQSIFDIILKSVPDFLFEQLVMTDCYKPTADGRRRVLSNDVKLEYEIQQVEEDEHIEEPEEDCGGEGQDECPDEPVADLEEKKEDEDKSEGVDYLSTLTQISNHVNDAFEKGEVEVEGAEVGEVETKVEEAMDEKEMEELEESIPEPMADNAFDCTDEFGVALMNCTCATKKVDNKNQLVCAMDPPPAPVKNDLNTEPNAVEDTEARRLLFKIMMMLAMLALYSLI